MCIRDRTDRCATALEEILAGQEGVASYTSRVGEPAFFGIPVEGGNANKAQIKVFVEPHRKNESAAIAAALQQKAAAMDEDARISFSRASLLDISGLETNLELTLSLIHICGGPDQSLLSLAGKPLFSSAEVPLGQRSEQQAR